MLSRVWTYIRVALSICVLASGASAQSSLKPVLCPDGSKGEACSSFNDAVEDEDTHIVEAVRKRDHVVVCFREREDVFLLLSYDSPHRSAWTISPDHTGVQQKASADFLRFRNGNANLGGESLLQTALRQPHLPKTCKGVYFLGRH